VNNNHLRSCCASV